LGVTCVGGGAGTTSATVYSVGGLATGGDTNVQGNRGTVLDRGTPNNSLGGSSSYGQGAFTIGATATPQLADAYGAGGASSITGNNSVAGMPGVLDLSWT